ncbi:retrotransposon protein, putative, ty1-copia subclass, partial [Tanacetum coccineum]
KLNYLEQPLPPAPVAPEGQQVAPEIIVAHNAWIKGLKEIVGLMLMTMEPKIQQNLENLHTNDMLKELKTLFAQQAEQELLQITRDFHSCKQEEGQSVRYYNYNMHSLGKTVNELHAMLKLHKQTLPKNNAPALYAIRAGKGENKLAFAPKPKIPPPPKREYPAKDLICHECGETGHWKRNYPQYLAELLKRKKFTQTITRGVISVSRLYEDGFINRFVNNTIQLSRNNMVYFSVILRDGIFEIDLSNSYANKSSIYIVSNKRAKIDLDSALLWHCRLGHISKKRIEKLQHDALLNSTDLRAFEKCVPCMSGKMARKPYTPQHNGVSERRNRTLLDMVRSMMSQTTLPTSFLDYALDTAAHILNMVPTKKVEKTPYNVWSIKCIFVGYPKETMGYSFYYPPQNKVFVARNAKFLENSLITQEASGSLEDLEIIQEEDTHPSIDTSLHHKEYDLEIDEPQNDIIPICRSTRTRNDLNHMCLYIDAEEHELGDLGEPANYKAALLDPESNKWLNAINVEMQSMKDNEVWELVDLPPNGKNVGSKWLFKKKTDMDGVIHTYKARLVAKGYTQTPRIDYEETFSPVADIRAIRILIAIVAFYDYEIWQIDVKTAFLNGYLSEEVYMEQPEGASTLAELKRMKNVPYASAVGDLYWTTMKNILKYIRNAKDMFLVYRGDIKRELRVSCYTDAGYLTDANDLKSQTRYVFVLNGGAIDWKSTKKSI